jgi:endogenous inhibitor of DNA gyrase (YacG/DUF329 family)
MVKVKTCICGKEFTPTNNRQKYCCEKCWWRGHGKEHRQESKLRINRKCPNCGKMFATTDGRKKFCSDKCKIKFSNDARHHPHKGIKGQCEVCGKEYTVTRNPTKRTCSNRCAKFKCKYDGNRLKALVRDNFTCQKCGGSHKKQLHVHHKDCSGLAENPNHGLENLVTLCTTCHAQIHKVLRAIEANKSLI